MSLPKPAPNESENEFIGRCIATLLDCGLAQDASQGAAICYKQWEESKKPLPKTNLMIFESTIIPVDVSAELTGKEWEVTIIGPKTPEHLIVVDGEEFVRSENNRLYSVAALAKSVSQWDGIKVYDNHLTDEEFMSRQGMRSPKSEWLGTIVQPVWDPVGRKLTGIFKVVDDSLAAKLKSAWEQKVLSSIGLSIDTYPIVNREIYYEGVSMIVADGFEQILSVDLVGDPATGGGFNRLIAGMTHSQISTIEGDMNMLTDDEIKALIADATKAQLAAPEFVTTLTDSVKTAVEAALAAHAEPPIPEEEAPGEEEPTTEAEPEEEAPAADESAAMAEAKKARCELKLLKILAEAKLPREFEAIVTNQFGDKIFEEADLVKFVKTMKEAIAAKDPSGRVVESGGHRIIITTDQRDIAEVEFLRLLSGNETFRNIEHQKESWVRERIPESYSSWIKASRPNYGTRRISEWVYNLLGGNPFTDQRAYESITTSGMSSIVKNALNLLLACDYQTRTRWWEPIVRVEEVDTIDQATLVRTYGMNNLDVVDEGNAYTELLWTDDEETAAFVKKGNYVGVTLEALLNDKLNVLRTIPSRLSNVWYNTLSALNAAVFTCNTLTGPVLTDTGALFNATAVTTAGGHANLLTTALGTVTTAYAAARLAMQKQTDQALGVGRRLNIIPKYLLVPTDLEVSAKIIMGTLEVPGSAYNDINPYYQEAQIVVVPDWTSTTNWALVADPAIWPAIWNIFLRGQRVPQLFTSDQETAGALFTNDTLRYKVRMMTWRAGASYDCSPVADFRGLHKSNI